LKAVKRFGQLELGFDSYSTLPLELALVDCALPAEDEKVVAASQPQDELREPVRTTTPTPSPEPAAPPSPPVQPEPPVAKVEPATEPEASIKPEPNAEPESTIEPEPSTEPEAPIEPPPVAEPEVAARPGSKVEQLIQSWRQIIRDAPPELKKTPAMAILRSADVRPVDIENDTVILCSKFDFYREQIEKPENQRIAVQILSSYLGHPCQVRCIHKPENNHMLRAALNMGAQVTGVEEK